MSMSKRNKSMRNMQKKLQKKHFGGEKSSMGVKLPEKKGDGGDGERKGWGRNYFNKKDRGEE